MTQCCLAVNCKETWKHFVVADCYVRECYRLLHLRGRASLRLTLVDHSAKQVRKTFVRAEAFRNPFCSSHTLYLLQKAQNKLMIMPWSSIVRYRF